MSAAATPVPSLAPGSPVPSLIAGSPVDSVVDSQADSQPLDGVDHPNSQGSNPGDVPIDLGAAMLQSPIIRDRRRDTLLTTATLNAMHLHNELNGGEGMHYPVPNPGQTLFPIPGTPGATQGPPPVVHTVVVPPRTITIDGRTLTLKTTPASKDTFTTPRL